MVDVVFLFSTAHFEDELEAVIDRIQAKFSSAVVMGCTAAGTIGSDQELERGPSMSLLVGSLPDVCIRPFHLTQDQLDSAKTALDWERITGVSPESRPAFIAFADPFKLDVSACVDALNTHYPDTPLVGGIATAAHEPGQNRLIVNGEIHRDGLVAVSLVGPLVVDTVVSQGCRPVGKPLVITKGERNVVFELGGHAALKQLHDLLVRLPDEDQRLARQALLVGRVIDEHKSRFERGDFLIQNILGVDRVRGAIGIAGHARVGATIQFHVRDAASADEDLQAMVARFGGRNVCGALLFGCNGRGTNMWPEPGHDAGVLEEHMPNLPVAGFFCGGEFGPVGGMNFIHGFTASIALFREPNQT